MAEEEELKRAKKESEKAGGKFNIQKKTKIMASSPITSWQIEATFQKVEIVTNFIFLSSKITVDSDFSYEIQRCLLLGRKV